MKNLIIVFTICTTSIYNLKAQQIFTATNQQPEGDFENVWTKKIFSDSLATSTLIWIKNTVKLHKHEHHTEHIYVLEGSGDMSIGGETVSIFKGDVLIIPKNTSHSLKVTSRDPLKIISIQSPEFFGKDRVFLD